MLANPDTVRSASTARYSRVSGARSTSRRRDGVDSNSWYAAWLRLPLYARISVIAFTLYLIVYFMGIWYLLPRHYSKEAIYYRKDDLNGPYSRIDAPVWSPAPPTPPTQTISIDYPAKPIPLQQVSQPRPVQPPAPTTSPSPSTPVAASTSPPSPSPSPAPSPPATPTAKLDKNTVLLDYPQTPAFPIAAIQDPQPLSVEHALLSPAKRLEAWGVGRPAAGTRSWDAQFGNGFSQSFVVCDNSATGGAKIVGAHNPTTRATYFDVSNLVLDTTKISMSRGGEEIASVRNRKEEEEFPKFTSGALFARCIPTKTGLDITRRRTGFLFNHLNDMIPSITFSNPPTTLQQALTDNPIPDCEAYEETPTLMLTRYEYANIYHTLGDWYNAVQAAALARVAGPQRLNVLFIDGHSKSAMDSSWPRIFSFPGARPSVRYLHHLPHKRTCFRRAVIVPPAYTSAVAVSMMGIVQSPSRHPALHDFISLILNGFGVRPFPPPSTGTNKLPAEEFALSAPHPNSLARTKEPSDSIQALLVLRKYYLAHPRIGPPSRLERVLAQPDTIVAAGKAAGVDVQSVYFEDMTLEQQIHLVSQKDILIGLHGAGLTHLLFMPPSSYLIEIMPASYQSRQHYRHMANWAGTGYASIPAEGSSRFTVNKSVMQTRLGEAVAHVRAARARQLEAQKRDGRTGNLPEIPPMNTAIRTVTTRGHVEPPAPKFTMGQATPVLPPEPPTPESMGYPQSMGDPKSPHVIATHRVPPGARVPEHRLLIIVPFRESKAASSQGANRFKNLAEFVPHMTQHIEYNGRKRHIDFSILVVEQDQELIFNKGALLNIGYDLAKTWGYDYMALHDVDQLPEHKKNDYRYPNKPIHLCTASEQFGYRPAYPDMVGGVLLINLKDYEAVNGYSNFYWGWGQEDDDFYYRLRRSPATLERMSPRLGRYKTLSHPRVKDLDATPLFMRGQKHLRSPNHAQAARKDGISNLKYRVIRYERDFRVGPLHKVTVALDFDFKPIDLNGRQATDPPGFVPNF